MNNWNGGAETRRLYEYKDEDRNRMGSCKWLPKDGDLCLCIAHSGDCFYDYIAIRKQDDGTYKRVGNFGAYCFGKPKKRISEKKFYLLCVGVPVRVA